MIKKNLNIIIAAYNEEKNINKLFKNYKKVFLILKNKFLINLIIVNDKSTDNTKNLIVNNYKFFLKKNIINDFKLLNNSKQIGKGSCIIKAIKKSKDGIIFLDDADNECHPNNIFKFLKKIRLNNFLCGDRGIYFLKTKIIYWPFVIGVKLTNFFFNLRYSSNLSDIHCAQKMFYNNKILKNSLASNNFLIDTELCKFFISKKFRYLNIKCIYNRRSINSGKKMTYFKGFLLVAQIIKLMSKT